MTTGTVVWIVCVDIFVSGLQSSTILNALLQDYENKSYNECVEKAKNFEVIF